MSCGTRMSFGRMSFETMLNPLLSEIEKLSECPGLEPETVTLLKMAADAQRTGEMPPLPTPPPPRLKRPGRSLVNQLSPGERFMLLFGRGVVRTDPLRVEWTPAVETVNAAEDSKGRRG